MGFLASAEKFSTTVPPPVAHAHNARHHEIAVGIVEVVAPLDLADTEGAKHGQGEDQDNDQQVLDLGEDIHADEIQKQENGQDTQSNGLHRLRPPAEEGAEVVGQRNTVHGQGQVADDGGDGLGTCQQLAAHDRQLGVGATAKADTGGDENKGDGATAGDDSCDEEGEHHAPSGDRHSGGQQGHNTGADDLAHGRTHQVPKAQFLLQLFRRAALCCH